MVGMQVGGLVGGVEGGEVGSEVGGTDGAHVGVGWSWQQMTTQNHVQEVESIH